MLTALRHKLSDVTQNVAVPEHLAHVEALRTETNHSIVVVESQHPIDRYTCGVHAFHLIEDPTYLSVACSGLRRTFAGTEFIDFLLERQLLTPREGSSAIPDDLILYFDNEVFRHVGRVRPHHRVLSKWGAGHLYEHQVWEVPFSYGNQVRYFVGPDKDSSCDLFIQYAESKGFSFGESD